MSDLNNNKKQLFTNKPAIKLCFKDELATQSTPPKRIKKNEVSENNKNMSSMLKERGFKLENCTLNNCVFNMYTCSCNKENN